MQQVRLLFRTLRVMERRLPQHCQMSCLQERSSLLREDRCAMLENGC